MKEELTSLRAKVIVLEHDLHKSCQEASKNHDLCYQLENEYDVSGQVVELLLLLGKSERGLAITCLKSVLCWTGKSVCVWCVRIFLSKTWIAQPHTSSPSEFEN
ncbi:hypothetical protein NC651_039869 [Populus alba x Populus x berolinensis]|nr:hypothetical protein NC651_039869 [Populus alba x Populus x berolinensis]